MSALILDDPAGDPASGAPRRVHFVHAPDPLYSRYQNFGNNYMPVWAYTIAAHLPPGHAVDLFDTRIHAVDEITDADVFLFSGLNQDHAWIREVHDRLRARFPGARFAIGGPICWSFDQAGELDKLEFFDLVAIGDGELLIGEVLERLAEPAGERPVVVKRTDRFDMAGALPMHQGLVAKNVGDYYGALVEVSRGCPFLCEFCDIRILMDNNRAHNKAPDAIIADMDFLARKGVRSFMFACDNFIGDLVWAREVVERIVAWREQTGFSPSIFTWLTINVYKDEALLAQMRRAGFDMLFIGVESFDQNSLLEMAKVQNRTRQAPMPEILRRIQAHGFVVTPGLIFGFDSDSERLYDVALEGLEESCLLTTNSGILVALPGTPLFRRMKLAGRLRNAAHHIGRFKFQTNVRYLLPADRLVDGYIDFVRRVSGGAHQYRRFRNFIENLADDQIVLEGQGYGNVFEYFRSVLGNPVAALNFARRLGTFAVGPARVAWALRGLALALANRRRGGLRYFQVWIYGWTNFVMQNWRIRRDDFDLESVTGPIVRETVLPAGYDAEDVREDIPETKTRAQLRATTRQLERLVERMATAGR